MTDTSKFKNVSLSIETYNLLKKHSEMVTGFNEVPLSLSQTVQHHCVLADDYLHEKELPKKCYALDNTKLGEQSSNHLEAKVQGFIDGKNFEKSLNSSNTKRKEFDDFVYDEIAPRNKAIYYHRVLASKKKTLQELGTMFNLSRERVRQIQEREVSTKKLNPQTQDKHANSN